MKATEQEQWIEEYLKRFRALLGDRELANQMVMLKDLFEEAQLRGSKVIIAGNGGSAAIASHCSVDLTKSAGIRCVNFNEADLITCLANDYGYEQWVAKAFQFYAEEGDLAILISSSGRSLNIINGTRKAKEIGLDVITLSGFLKDNPLRNLGDLNLWVSSNTYNVVEMTHHVWLVAIIDYLIAKYNKRTN